MDKFWALTRLEMDTKLAIYEAVVIPVLTSTLATLCPSQEDMRDLEHFHYDTLSAIYGRIQLENPWGTMTNISYEELLIWTQAQSMSAILGTLRINLAGRIARASRVHPLRQMENDEWDMLVREDLEKRGESESILFDRYNCRKLLKRKNPYTHKRK